MEHGYYLGRPNSWSANISVQKVFNLLVDEQWNYSVEIYGMRKPVLRNQNSEFGQNDPSQMTFRHIDCNRAKYL